MHDTEFEKADTPIALKSLDIMLKVRSHDRMVPQSSTCLGGSISTHKFSDEHGEDTMSSITSLRLPKMSAGLRPGAENAKEV